MVGPTVIGVLRRAASVTIGQAATDRMVIGGGELVWDRRPSWSPPHTRTVLSAGVRTALDRSLDHPVAAITILGTRLLGWPARSSLLAAITLDRLIPFATARHSAPAARFLRLWTLACRFRRRWPESLFQAERALERRVSVGTVASRADDGASGAHRTDGATDGTGRAGPRIVPDLARLPHRIEGTTVAWAIDLDPAIDPADLGRGAGGLSLLDPHILRVDLERRADDWEVVVDFDIEPPTWALSVPGRGQVFASVSPAAAPNRQHEEGRSHGNG